MTDNYTPGEPQAAAAAANQGEVGFVQEAPRGNFVVGILSGLALGVLAAILYGVITFATGNEYGILSALIGIAVAFGFSRFGHTQGWLAGGIAAVIAAVLYIVAIFIGMAGLLSKELGVGFGEGLQVLLENAGLALELYFEDPLSYVFLAIAVIIAFVSASGIRNKKDDAEAYVASRPGPRPALASSTRGGAGPLVFGGPNVSESEDRGAAPREPTPRALRPRRAAPRARHAARSGRSRGSQSR